VFKRFEEHQHTQGPILPIPYPYRLVVGAGKDPGQLMVEENSTNVVKVTIERKKTPPRLMRPDFDLVVVAPRNEQRLRIMEINAPYWSIMFLETVNESAHTIVP